MNQVVFPVCTIPYKVRLQPMRKPGAFLPLVAEELPPTSATCFPLSLMAGELLLAAKAMAKTFARDRSFLPLALLYVPVAYNVGTIGIGPVRQLIGITGWTGIANIDLYISNLICF